MPRAFSPRLHRRWGALRAPILLAAAAAALPAAALAQPEAGREPLDVLGIVLGILAGLALFLYGVTLLSDGLNRVAGDRMKTLLARFTTNRFAGVATGAAATTVLDSSSVTIIMVIALVNAGLLTFVQSLGVIMGSNIGTTVSSQVIAFDVERYSPVLLVAGLLLAMLGRTEGMKGAGRAVLGAGLVLFGLGEMGEAVEPLEGQPWFTRWMTELESPLLGAAVGALATVLIQSSSATLGIVITLAGQGLVTLPAGVAIMLGAEIGTCADTLVATAGRSREAVRAGVFHLFFNVSTVAVGLLFTRQLADLAVRLTPGADVARHIANAHVLFNVIGVALFIGFTPWIARALQAVIPDARRAPAPELAPGD